MPKIMAALEKAFTKLRRKSVSITIFNKYDGVVQHGPFKGLKINGKANTSSGTLGGKMLGVYEPEVMQEIVDLGPFEDVVNFGAADGYFSLGVLIGGLAKRSIAFEMTQKGQQAVKDNAAQNNLSEKVIVRGIADDSVGPQLAELGYNTNKGLLLCDIEGAEFSVLSEKVLNDLKGTTIIIELHDRMMIEGLALREALIARLPKGAKHRILTSKPTLWIGNADIEAMSDNDRALICSEGRKVLGEWLIVTY